MDESMGWVVEKQGHNNGREFWYHIGTVAAYAAAVELAQDNGSEQAPTRIRPAPRWIVLVHKGAAISYGDRESAQGARWTLGKAGIRSTLVY
jgi:hypothetical protein